MELSRLRPINADTCARAVSITPLSFDPNLHALDGG
jgi:hypothetical protein